MDIEGVADIVLEDCLNENIHPDQVVCEFEMPANPFLAFQYLEKLEQLFIRMRKLNYRTYSITQNVLGARIEFLGVRERN